MNAHKDAKVCNQLNHIIRVEQGDKYCSQCGTDLGQAKRSADNLRYWRGAQQ